MIQGGVYFTNIYRYFVIHTFLFAAGSSCLTSSEMTALENKLIEYEGIRYTAYDAQPSNSYVDWTICRLSPLVLTVPVVCILKGEGRGGTNDPKIRWKSPGTWLEL